MESCQNFLVHSFISVSYIFFCFAAGVKSFKHFTSEQFVFSCHLFITYLVPSRGGAGIPEQNHCAKCDR